MNRVEWAKARLAEAVAAFALLTRLPVGLIPVPWTRELRRAAWAYPLVGALRSDRRPDLFGHPRPGRPSGTCRYLRHDGHDPRHGRIARRRSRRCSRRPRRKIAGGPPCHHARPSHRHLWCDRACAFAGNSHRRGAILAEPSLVISALIASGAASRGSATALMAIVPHARDDGLSRSVGLASNKTRSSPSRSSLRSPGSRCHSEPRLASS